MRSLKAGALAAALLVAPPAWADEPAEAPHAPPVSLWAGARASFLAFGFGFFANDPRRGLPSTTETTGNFAGNGFAPQLDLGVRLARRFVPYLFWEHGFLAQGHRFAGSDATSSTDSFGGGIRFGGADRIGFIADLSVGKRIVRVSEGADTYAMSGFEVLRLALGGELRFATLYTVEATVSMAGGAMNEASGDITYSAAGSRDGRTHPAYKNGSIDQDSTTYVVITAGVGVHFDLFGR